MAEPSANLLEFERQFWNKGYSRVAGVDEAGRGPLAGPVVAAAVVFDRNFIEKEKDTLFVTLTDSKQLSEQQRNNFFSILTQSPEIEIGIGFGTAAEIDTINILLATHLTMNRALAALHVPPDYAIIDGLPVKNLPCPSMALVKGDARSLSVAAASVIAKVVRDQLMIEIDRWRPEYGFRHHKGYGTPAHIQALFKYGPMEHHRRSFRPVREIEAIRKRKKVQSS
jgi:ribonuclease HII